MKCPKCQATLVVRKEGTVAAGGQMELDAKTEPAMPPFTPAEETPPLPPTLPEEPPPFTEEVPPPPPADDFSFEELDQEQTGAGDQEFSFDDALADLDEELQLDKEETIPLTPDMTPPPELPDDQLPERVFDEPMSDELPGELGGLFEDTETKAPAPEAAEDEFALDMPSLLESAAAELEKEMTTAEKEDLPPLNAPSKSKEAAEFPDQGFSFEDMLDESDLAGGQVPEVPPSEPGLAEAGQDVSQPPEGPPAPTSAGEPSRPFGDVESDFLSGLPDIGSEGEEVDKVILYQIRRKNGKIFGPFPVETIAEMIETAKLQGDEDVSQSGDDWIPIGKVDAFAQAISTSSGGQAELDAFMPEKPAKLEEEKRKVLEERQKRRRAGSLEVVTPMKRRKLNIRFKIVIPAALLAVLLLFIGYFELIEEVSFIDVVTGQNIAERQLVDQLKSRHRKRFDEAQKHIMRDNYQGYTKARDICLDLLKEPEFRGRMAVYALLAQVDYQILRRFGASKHLSKEAKDAFAKVETIKREEAEILFAKATKLMYDKKFGQSKDLLLTTLIKDSKNTKALHLIAETFLFLPDKAPAEKYIEKIIEMNQVTARTYYLQGRLNDVQNDLAKAKESYAKALEKDPEHLDSQIELAGILLKEEGGGVEAKRALDTIRKTFDDRMSKKQLARVYYYLAKIYMQEDKPYEVVRQLAFAIDNEPDNYLYNMILGQYLMNRHEFEKAREQFELCIRNNPEEIRCYLDLGRAFLVLEHPDKALFKLEEAVKIAPKNAELHFLMGRALEKLFQPQKSLSMYEKAISLDPNGIAYYTSAAMSYLKQDNLTKAGEYIQKSKLIDANSPLVHNFLGRMHLHQGDMEKAEEEFNRAIEANPEFIEAHYHLANAYRDNKKFEEAIRQYNEVLGLDDKNDAAYFGLGRTYIMMDELDKAITEYEKALNLNKRNYEYFFEAGIAYYQKEDFEKAKSALEEAQNLKPSFALAAFYLGRLYMDQKQFDKANEYFEQAIQLEPKEAQFVFYMGWLWEMQEKYADALDFYELALNYRKDYAEVYLRKGITLRAQNKFKPAIKMFLLAQKYDPTITMARIELGDCFFEMRKYPLAIEQYQEAIKMDDKDPEAYRKLGLVYQELGKPKQAITHYKKAISFDANDPQPHLGLGYAFKALRRKGEAIKQFELYLELNPTAIDKDEVEDEIFFLKKR